MHRDIHGAIRGGNYGNGTNCGAFYVNLNNSASNANSNLGAANSYQQILHTNAVYIP